MKLSKLTFAAILMLTVLASCTQSKEKGVAMAKDFVKAWNSDGDTLTQEIAKINAALDSLTFKAPFVDAFTAEAGRADSTVALAARVLLNGGDDVASSLCDAIIDGLASGTLHYTQANAKGMQLAQVCSRLNKEELNKSFGTMLDSKAAALPLDKQMKVYSSATSPEKLGEALRADAQAPGADKALIARQVEALKTIYNSDDYKKFFDSYKND